MIRNGLAAADLSPESSHEHAWVLRGVEFTDGVSVEEFACHDCSEVWFR